MAEHLHHFKLKLPNGAEVDFGGDKDFVTEVYRDTKAAAVTLFNREAARTSRDAAADRVLGPKDQEPPSLFSMPPASQAALPSGSAAPASVTSTALSQPPAGHGTSADKGKDEKPKKPKLKIDQQKRDAKTARAAEVEKILKAGTFDDDVAYTSALKVAVNPLDRAALVTRLAQEKFGIDSGLSPAETLTILEKRFYIGQDNRSLQEAMKDAPTGFFVAAPAPFDGRAKLYRPVMGCIDHVNKLLEPHKNVPAVPAPAAGGNGATA